MDEAKLKSLKKDAQVSMAKPEKPNGHIYAFVKGKKEFFPIEKVEIASYEMTVSDLVRKVLNQEERINKLKTINLEMLEKIDKLEKELKVWIGM